MKVKNIRHLMLGITCLVLAVICLAVGAAGGSAPKYLISAVLLLALGAVNFHGALKGGAEQELLRWTDTYTIDIAQPEDVLLCLMIVLAIDAAKCSSGN